MDGRDLVRLHGRLAAGVLRPARHAARAVGIGALRRPRPGRGHDGGRGGRDGREREVLTLVGRGLSNAEIAADLTLSVATVKTYVTRLLTKLDARDRIQLVIIAYQSGLAVTS